jgi:enoyl-CoA hydratase
MTVTVDRSSSVAVVTIDRPAQRNAVDRPTADLLEQTFVDLDRDPGVHAAVLTGADNTFCAGADLHAIARGETDRINRIERSTRGPMGPSRLDLDLIVVAAIEGHAVAGGLELALWCDLRVAASDAVLGVFCRRWGVPLIDGGTVRLPRLIGESRALDLVLTGRPVTADEAFHIGLVNRVCAPGEALATAIDLAATIVGFPITTTLADRRSVRRSIDLPLDEAMLREHDGGVAAIEAGGMADVARFEAGEGRSGQF